MLIQILMYYNKNSCDFFTQKSPNMLIVSYRTARAAPPTLCVAEQSWDYRFLLSITIP